MGWTFTHKEKGTDLTKWFVEHGVLRWSETCDYEYKVLAGKTVNLSTYYGAVEKVHKETGERAVFAVVILIRHVRTKRGWGENFGYKDMSEEDGPCEAECPKSILELLTPTESEYANDWRQRCRVYQNARAQVAQLSPGRELVFKDPLRFRDGTEACTFQVTGRRKSKGVVCRPFLLPGGVLLGFRMLIDNLLSGDLQII